jgi:hypothetical protein
LLCKEISDVSSTTTCANEQRNGAKATNEAAASAAIFSRFSTDNGGKSREGNGSIHRHHQPL